MQESAFGASLVGSTSESHWPSVQQLLAYAVAQQCHDILPVGSGIARRMWRSKWRTSAFSVVVEVRLWPLADIPNCTAHVRFQEGSGHDRLRISAFAVAIGGKADMAYCTAYVCF